MKKLLASFFIFGLFYFIAAPISKIQAATNTFDCKWNITSCRAESESYADCSDGYDVDSDYCTAITDKESCQSATGVSCVSSNTTTTSTTTTSSGTWYNQSFQEWYGKVYDTNNPNEIFGERYTAAQVQWIVYSIPSIVINLITGGNADLGNCLVEATTGATDLSVCNEAILKTKNSLLSLNPNANKQVSIASQIFGRKDFSGIGYIKNVFSKLDPVTTVQAQDTDNGYGMAALGPITKLWKISRNIAYFLFIIVVVIFAFMIMFRVKLSPQTVVTIQSALPKVIIALILVTFSFAIAGLLIDLMYVVMALLATLLSPLIGDSATFIFGFMNASNFGGGLALLLYFTIYMLMYLLALIAIALAAVVGLNFSSAVFAVFLLVFAVVLIVILVWYIFKVTFVLFKNLATIYGLVIVAPLQISLGAIYPQAGFGSWMKKFVSKLMVFPLTGAFIYLAIILLFYSIKMSGTGMLNNNVIVELMGIIGIATGDFSAPVGSWAPPLLGNAASAGGIAFLLMSVGLIMMIPKISESIDSFLAGKGIAGTAIGEAMGPFGGLAKTAGGTATSVGMGAGSLVLGNKLRDINLKDKKLEQLIRSAGNALSGYGSKTLGKEGGQKTPPGTVDSPNDVFRS